MERAKAVSVPVLTMITSSADLAPGHPMVSGQQNVEFDLCMWEHSKLIILWGMNPFTTFMVGKVSLVISNKG